MAGEPMVVELMLSFIATLSYGVLFNIPSRALLGGGLIGMLGWLLYTAIAFFDASPLIATWVASFTVATASNWLARFHKVPVTAFSIAGIIPLVPGAMAYSTMLSMVEGNTAEGLRLATRTLLSAGAIAGGLVVSVAINRIWKGFAKQNDYQTEGK